MLMLGGEPFTQGRSRFLDHPPGGSEPTAKVFVRVEFQGLEAEQLAQLDTGAPWSILDPETAEQLGVLEAGADETIPVRTLHGTKEGHPIRLRLTLVAEEGQDLEVEGTFLVIRDWPGGIFLGYSSLLDHIRLALDPVENRFYFGPPAERP